MLDSGKLSGRAGAIQAAINLEIHSEKIDHIDIKLSGLNGQLPNLDLVNLAHRLCNKESVRHTFNNVDGGVCFYFLHCDLVDTVNLNSKSIVFE